MPKGNPAGYLPSSDGKFPPPGKRGKKKLRKSAPAQKALRAGSQLRPSGGRSL